MKTRLKRQLSIMMAIVLILSALNIAVVPVMAEDPHFTHEFEEEYYVEDGKPGVYVEVRGNFEPVRVIIKKTAADSTVIEKDVTGVYSSYTGKYLGKIYFGPFDGVICVKLYYGKGTDDCIVTPEFRVLQRVRNIHIPGFNVKYNEYAPEASDLNASLPANALYSVNNIKWYEFPGGTSEADMKLEANADKIKTGPFTFDNDKIYRAAITVDLKEPGRFEFDKAHDPLTKGQLDTISLGGNTDIVDPESSRLNGKTRAILETVPLEFARITYQSGDPNATGTDPDTQYVADKTLYMPEPCPYSLEHYTFAGWRVNDRYTVPADVHVMVDGDTELMATWQPEKCKISFDPAEGSGNMEDVDISYGRQYILPECGFDPPKEDDKKYRFKKWSLNVAGVEVTYDVGDPYDVEGDVMFRAVWEEIPEYEVTFDHGQNGKGTMDAHKVPEGEYKLPAIDECPLKPENAGYEFVYWHVDRNGLGSSNYYAGSVIEVKSNIKVTAVWSDISHVAIFDPGEGNGEPVSVNVIPNADYNGAYVIEIPYERFEAFNAPEGKCFYGWSFDNNNGSGTAYPGNPVEVKEKEKWFVANWGDHIFETTSENAIDPTCTMDGSYDIVKTCRNVNCGHVETEHVVIPAPGHKWGEEYSMTCYATCEEDGYENTWAYCDVCGELSSNMVPIKAQGHKYGDPIEVVTQEPTCTVSGNRYEYQKCTVCGHETDPVYSSIDPPGHSWSGTISEDIVKARCDIPGTVREYRKCLVCEVEETINAEKEVPPPGHDFEYHKVDAQCKAPTCSENGYDYYLLFCKNCDLMDELTVSVNATGNHEWDDGEEFTDKETGKEKIKYTCKVCGQTKTEDVGGSDSSSSSSSSSSSDSTKSSSDSTSDSTKSSSDSTHGSSDSTKSSSDSTHGSSDSTKSSSDSASDSTKSSSDSNGHGSSDSTKSSSDSTHGSSDSSNSSSDSTHGSSDSSKSSSDSDKSDDSSSKKDDGSSSDKDKDSSSSDGTVSGDGMEKADLKVSTKDEKGKTLSFEVYFSKQVTYNGRKHVSNYDKASRSSVQDVKLEIKSPVTKYAEPKLKFKDNKNAYSSGPKRPRFYLSFKPSRGATKEQKAVIRSLNKELKSQPVNFMIKPLNLSEVKQSGITLKMNGKGTKVTRAIVKAGSLDVKLTKKDFTATIGGSDVKLTGTGNCSGTCTKKK